MEDDEPDLTPFMDEIRWKAAEARYATLLGFLGWVASSLPEIQRIPVWQELARLHRTLEENRDDQRLPGLPPDIEAALLPLLREHLKQLDEGLRMVVELVPTGKPPEPGDLLG